MDLKSILNVKLLKIDAERARFATMPQIGMCGVPQVRVSIVGRAMQLVGNHTQFKNNCTSNSQITLGFTSCNYFTVTGTIILELHSNVCDYLYVQYVAT